MMPPSKDTALINNLERGRRSRTLSLVIFAFQGRSTEGTMGQSPKLPGEHRVTHSCLSSKIMYGCWKSKNTLAYTGRLLGIKLHCSEIIHTIIPWVLIPLSVTLKHILPTLLCSSSWIFSQCLSTLKEFKSGIHPYLHGIQECHILGF